MKLFRFNPTIREANKYLTDVTNALSAKHGGVSNEEFEKELVDTTGIGWKQVKNYKNHPKPSERLKDNSVVLKYITQMREKDTGRKVRRNATGVLVLAGIFGGLYWYGTKPKTVEQFIIHEVPPNNQKTQIAITRIFLKLESKKWLFRLGPIETSKVPIDQFSCFIDAGLGTKSCSFNEVTPAGNMQAFILLDGDIVRRYSIMSFDQKDIQNLMVQLSDLLGERIKGFPAKDKAMDELKVDLESESVNLLGSYPRPGARPYFSVVISLR